MDGSGRAGPDNSPETDREVYARISVQDDDQQPGNVARRQPPPRPLNGPSRARLEEVWRAHEVTFPGELPVVDERGAALWEAATLASLGGPCPVRQMLVLVTEEVRTDVNIRLDRPLECLDSSNIFSDGVAAGLGSQPLLGALQGPSALQAGLAQYSARVHPPAYSTLEHPPAYSTLEHPPAYSTLEHSAAAPLLPGMPSDGDVNEDQRGAALIALDPPTPVLASTLLLARLAWQSGSGQ